MCSILLLEFFASVSIHNVTFAVCAGTHAGRCLIFAVFLDYLNQNCGPGSSVGIAIGYGLDGPGIEFRWGARFSAPVQTGPGAHPASCTMGTGSFPGVKSGRGVNADPSPPSSAVVKKG